jgi:acyl carrier protein
MVAVQEDARMSRPELPILIAELKSLVLDAAEKPEPEGGLGDAEILFGDQSRLALDSLDALQVSMAIQQRYGVRMTDSKETRRALSSVAFLADYLQARLP